MIERHPAWSALAMIVACACSRGHGSEAKAAPAPSTSSSASESAPTATPPADAASNRLLERFKNGDFAGVVDYCQKRGQDADDVTLWCTSLIPAGLHALGRRDQGLDYSEQHCANLPPADSSRARAAYIALMMIALSEAARWGNYKASKPERDELLNSWLDVCLVPPEQIEQVLQQLTQPR